MSDVIPLLIGLLGTIIGATPAIIVALINRNKTNAEGVNILSAAYAGLVQPQGQIIDRLKAELLESDRQFDDLMSRYSKLLSCAQMLYFYCIDNNLNPPCMPDGVADRLK